MVYLTSHGILGFISVLHASERNVAYWQLGCWGCGDYATRVRVLVVLLRHVRGRQNTIRAGRALHTDQNRGPHPVLLPLPVAARMGVCSTCLRVRRDGVPAAVYQCGH